MSEVEMEINKKIESGRLFQYAEDIAEIIHLREYLKECAEKDRYFEIGGSSSEVLWQYITSLENRVNLID